MSNRASKLRKAVPCPEGMALTFRLQSLAEPKMIPVIPPRVLHLVSKLFHQKDSQPPGFALQQRHIQIRIGPKQGVVLRAGIGNLKFEDPGLCTKCN